MLIPRHWARVTVQIEGAEGSVTAYGWSNESQADAESRALERARDRADRVGSGFEFFRLRRSAEYYSLGPPREERLESVTAGEDEVAVITRNRYGARVLNAADVVFLDLDRDAAERQALGPPPRGPIRLALGLLVPALGFALFSGALLEGHPPVWGIIAAVVLVGSGAAFAQIVGTILRHVRRARRRRAAEEAGHADLAAAAVAAWAAAWPGEAWRLDATAAGYRLILLGRRLTPEAARDEGLFDLLPVDPLYRRLCEGQATWRARLTPKPWRIDCPRADFAWPPRGPREEEARRSWVADYEAASEGRAVTRTVASHGKAADEVVRTVLAAHDGWAQRAESAAQQLV